jgi:hypothetical protein
MSATVPTQVPLTPQQIQQIQQHQQSQSQGVPAVVTADQQAEILAGHLEAILTLNIRALHDMGVSADVINSAVNRFAEKLVPANEAPQPIDLSGLKKGLQDLYGLVQAMEDEANA